jgi:hypothetical protein
MDEDIKPAEGESIPNQDVLDFNPNSVDTADQILSPNNAGELNRAPEHIMDFDEFIESEEFKAMLAEREAEETPAEATEEETPAIEEIEEPKEGEETEEPKEGEEKDKK